MGTTPRPCLGFLPGTWGDGAHPWLGGSTSRDSPHIPGAAPRLCWEQCTRLLCFLGADPDPSGVRVRSAFGDERAQSLGVPQGVSAVLGLPGPC